MFVFLWFSPRLSCFGGFFCFSLGGFCPAHVAALAYPSVHLIIRKDMEKTGETRTSWPSRRQVATLRDTVPRGLGLGRSKIRNAVNNFCSISVLCKTHAAPGRTTRTPTPATECQPSASKEREHGMYYVQCARAQAGLIEAMVEAWSAAGCTAKGCVAPGKAAHQEEGIDHNHGANGRLQEDVLQRRRLVNIRFVCCG